jgi:major intracellular serine protease
MERLCVGVKPAALLPLSASLCLCFALETSAAGALDRPRVPEEARSALKADGKVVLFVNFKRPEAPISGFSSWTARDPDATQTYVDALRLSSFDIETSLSRAGRMKVRVRFTWLPTFVVEIEDASVLDALELLDEVESVHADRRGAGQLSESAPYIRAPEARALGVSGEGSVVAVLDTGVDTDHPSLSEAIVFQWHSLDEGANQGPGAEDDEGHGTNVTGIIASRGGVAPLGIAPGAKIAAIKVLDSLNTGWFSDWVAGLDKVISLKEIEGLPVDAINMSFVGRDKFTEDCDAEVPAFSMACKAARDHGIAIFAASGNRKPYDTLPVPACYSAVISVGSVLDYLPDQISFFTDRNGSLDLLAPGEDITSCGLRGGISTISGTSQASPHAAAVACFLREIDPLITPDSIREVLMRSGKPYHDDLTGRVYPILDARAAVEAILVPRLQGFHCAANGTSLTASWSAQEGVEHFHLRAVHDGSSAFEGDAGGAETSFVWTPSQNGLHTLCVRPVNSDGLQGLEECCSLDVEGQFPFVRGDCNPDGELDISDPIRILFLLFVDGEQPVCQEACNANHDSSLDISDPVYLLSYSFMGGPPPPAPFGECAIDPNGAPLGCEGTTCPR